MLSNFDHFCNNYNFTLTLSVTVLNQPPEKGIVHLLRANKMHFSYFSDAQTFLINLTNLRVDGITKVDRFFTFRTINWSVPVL